MKLMRGLTNRLRRKKFFLVYAVTICVALSTVMFHQSIPIPDSLNEHLNTMYEKADALFGDAGTVETKSEFYDRVLDTIVSHSPNTTIHPWKRGKGCQVRDVGVADNFFYSKNSLDSCFELEDYKFQDLKASHDYMLEHLPREFPKGTYKGDGVVIVGGGRFSLLAALSIKTMRYRGTTLPVEVFIPMGEEEDPAVCEYLATMDARCISIANITSNNATIAKLQIKGYQLKSLAMMASSFENILLLDADNTPAVQNITNVFNVAPFNETGLVTWPDYWKRVTSPIFYRAAGIELGPRIRAGIDSKSPLSQYVSGYEDLDREVPMHDRRGSIPDGSTESGQLLINKTKHAGSILLGFYYNFNGPKYYYRLLGQATAGEGDKDTFLAAATVLGESYYQVKRGPGTEGYFRNGGFHGTCMIQADPVQDYELFNSIPDDTDSVGYKKIAGVVGTGGFYFLHAHLPKLDPFGLYRSGEVVEKSAGGVEKHVRLYSNMRKWGVDYDYELMQFKHMQEVLCDNVVPFTFLLDKSMQERAKVCKFVAEHVVGLQSSSAGFGGIR